VAPAHRARQQLQPHLHLRSEGHWGFPGASHGPLVQQLGSSWAAAGRLC
jgi:hypothetical protein